MGPQSPFAGSFADPYLNNRMQLLYAELLIVVAFLHHLSPLTSSCCRQPSWAYGSADWCSTGFFTMFPMRFSRLSTRLALPFTPRSHTIVPAIETRRFFRSGKIQQKPVAVAHSYAQQQIVACDESMSIMCYACIFFCPFHSIIGYRCLFSRYITKLTLSCPVHLNSTPCFVNVQKWSKSVSSQNRSAMIEPSRSHC